MTLSRMPEPDRAVLDRSGTIIKDLETLVGLEGVISEEDGRRAFETDALTAYRQMPLAVVLPRTTEDVSRVLKYCNQNRLKVVPRGAGTSLCGGALPTADCIVDRHFAHEPRARGRLRQPHLTVETGITNLAISDAVSAEGFFYAPDPSSQLACTIAGNLAMNSGGAHCLKYGVTTNNVLGLKIVLMDGEVVEIGGPYLDAEGYDFLALIVGSEGQFGIVTEATRADPAASRGARARCCSASIRARRPASASPPSSARASSPSPSSTWTSRRSTSARPSPRPAIRSMSKRCSSSRSKAPRTRSPACLRDIVEIARAFDPKVIEVSTSAEQSARIWKGRKAAFGAIGRISDYYCMDGTIPLGQLPRCWGRSRRSAPRTASRSPTSSTPATATCIRSSSTMPTIADEATTAERPAPRS